MLILLSLMKLLKNACTSAKLFSAMGITPCLSGRIDLDIWCALRDRLARTACRESGVGPSARIKLKSVPLLTCALPWQPIQPPILTPTTPVGVGAGVTTLGGGTSFAGTAVGAPAPASLVEMRPWNCCSV